MKCFHKQLNWTSAKDLLIDALLILLLHSGTPAIIEAAADDGFITARDDTTPPPHHDDDDDDNGNDNDDHHRVESKRTGIAACLPKRSFAQLYADLMVYLFNVTQHDFMVFNLFVDNN